MPEQPSEVEQIREAYIGEAAHAAAAFREIEELLVDLEELEELVGESLYHTRASRFRERMHTLLLRVKASHRHTVEMIEGAITRSHLISLAVVLYKKQLKEAGIDNERTAAQVAVLNPVSLRSRRKREGGSRARARARLENERRDHEAALRRERETKTGEPTGND